MMTLSPLSHPAYQPYAAQSLRFGEKTRLTPEQIAERKALVVFPLRRRLSENGARQRSAQEPQCDAQGGPAPS